MQVFQLSIRSFLVHSDTEYRPIEFPVSHILLNLDQSVAFRTTTLFTIGRRPMHNFLPMKCRNLFVTDLYFLLIKLISVDHTHMIHMSLLRTNLGMNKYRCCSRDFHHCSTSYLDNLKKKNKHKIHGNMCSRIRTTKCLNTQ